VAVSGATKGARVAPEVIFSRSLCRLGVDGPIIDQSELQLERILTGIAGITLCQFPMTAIPALSYLTPPPMAWVIAA
jgi:hypothetical protein